jgi:hypothetical protein
MPPCDIPGSAPNQGAGGVEGQKADYYVNFCAVPNL